jgi:hypothetical protein
MVGAIAVLVIALGAVAAGWGHVRMARRMRGFHSVIGSVVGREVTAVPGLDQREALWGDGGGFAPKVTYRYTVEGREYTADRLGYVARGLKRSVAERALAAIPDSVQVWFDPAKPGEAFLTRHRPGLGYALMAGGGLAVALALLSLALR